MQNENYSCNYGYKYSMYLTREILSILSPYSSNISWYLSLVIMIMKTFHIRISHNYSFQFNIVVLTSEIFNLIASYRPITSVKQRRARILVGWGTLHGHGLVLPNPTQAHLSPGWVRLMWVPGAIPNEWKVKPPSSDV